MVDTQQLEELRGRSFALAYRLLGSVTAAEDVVQEALLRLHKAEQEGQTIESPRAWLATVTTRLGLDELRSARARRESYVGDWLPEPLLGDPAPGPPEQAELADSLSVAFLVVLESLSPEQRAVFLLHDVFDYPYGEVAEMIGVSEQNARQLASRARRHVESDRPRFETSDEQREVLADRFYAAAQEGDFGALEELLAGDVVLQGDGGGKAPALARAISGRVRVLRALRAWFRIASRVGGIEFRRVTLNGQPGALAFGPDGKLLNAQILEIADGRIQAVRSIVNPDKLGHLGPVGDAAALLREARGASD